MRLGLRGMYYVTASDENFLPRKKKKNKKSESRT